MSARTRSILWPGVGTFLVALATAPAASGQIYIWNGGTGDGPHSWNTNGNWLLSGVPTGFPNGAGVTASLLADWSDSPSINLNQAITVGKLFIDDTGSSGDVGVAINPNGGSLTFDNNGSNARLETLGTSGLSFTTAGVTLTSSLDVTTAVNFAFIGAVNGAGGINKSGINSLIMTATNGYTGGTTVSAGTLQIGAGGTSGTLPGDVSVASGAYIAFNRTNTYTYGGVISGDGGLRNFSSGTTVLTGANTYTGETSIQSGTLAIGTGGSIASPNTMIFSDATLQFTHDGPLTYSSSITGGGSVLMSSTGTIILTGTNTYSGGTTIESGQLHIGDGGTTGSITGNVVVNNAVLRFNHSNTQTYSGNISGNGQLHRNGTGTLILTGTNTHTGNTTVNAGTLQLGNGGSTGSVSGNITNNSAVAFNRSDATTYAGNISGMGTLTQAGTGTLILTSTNTYSGGTTISAGTLQIGSGGTGGSITGDVLNNSALVVNREGSLTLGGEISGTGGLTKQDSGTLILTGTNTYGGGTTVSGGTLQFGDGGATGSVTGNITNNAGVSFNRSNDVTFAGEISGSGSLLKLGSNTLTLTGDNSYGGGTLILGGTVQVGDGGGTGAITGDIGNFGAVVVNRSGVLDYGGVMSESGTLTKQGTGTLRLGGANTYSGTTTISGGVLAIGTGGATGSISNSSHVTNNATLIFNRTADYAYSGNISGSGSLFKVNSNTLTLSGTNTYTGDTNLEGGTLAFSSAASLGNSGAIRFSGGGLRWGAGNTTDISTRTVTFDVGGATLDTGANNVTLANAIGNGGSGALTKSGAGTLTLAGNNSYTGGTTISAGTLQIGNGGMSGSITGNVANNGGIAFNRSNDVTFAGTISGSGSLLKDSTGNLTLTADNTAGSTLIANGTLTLGNGGTTGSITGDIGNLSALVVNRSGTYDYAGVISQSGTLTKQGTGTLRLTGANTYTGLTTISGGVLAIGNGGATGSIAGNVTNNATLIFNRTADYSYGGAVSGTGEVFKVNTNTLTLTGTNSYSGTTHLEGGTLRVNGSLTQSAVTVKNGGTLGGSGTISQAVTVQSGGTINAGNSPGTLTLNDGLTLASGSTFAVEITGPLAGTGYDQVVVTSGDVALGGSTLSFPTISGTGYTVDTRLVILSETGSGSISGTFAGFADGAYIPALNGLGGFDWFITYSSSQVFMTPTPEPGAVLGVAAAGLGLAGWVRRRRTLTGCSTPPARP